MTKLYPYSSTSLIYSDASGNANITDISISGTDCDTCSNGYDSDNLNSGYAASISEATLSIGSIGGFDESEHDDANTCYVSTVEQLSIRPAGWQKRSVSPFETTQEEKDVHSDASHTSSSSNQNWRERRRKRSHSRKNTRKGTIASDFRDFLGWNSTGDEMDHIAQFQSNHVKSQPLEKVEKFKSVAIASTTMQYSGSIDDHLKGVLTKWSKYSVPCVVESKVQDSEEDVSTINDSRFDTENVPVDIDKCEDVVDFKIDRPAWYERAGGKLGWLYMTILGISVFTLMVLIIVVMAQRL